MRTLALLAGGIVIGMAVATVAGQSKPAPGGYIIEQDATVATAEPGPHAGGGQTIAYSFLKAPLKKPRLGTRRCSGI